MNAGQDQAIRVCLLDDNPYERAMLESWFRGDNAIEIIGSFDQLESTVPVPRETKPDIVRPG